MKNLYRIIEARNDRIGTEWLLVRQNSDDPMDVEEISRHSSAAGAAMAKAMREREEGAG